MATEVDCVSFHASESLASSDSSLLSTPELTPPSSSTSSIDSSENSFFSARSSNVAETTVDVKTVQGTGILGFEGRVQFPPKRPNFNDLGSPLSHDSPGPTPLSPPFRRPRKLRKARPHVPKLSLDSALTSVSGSLQTASPTALSDRQEPPRTTPIISHQPSTPGQMNLKRGRRSSLPTIPSATFYSVDKWNSGEVARELSEDLRAVRFLTPHGSTSKPLHRPRSPHPTTLRRNISTHALVSLAWTGQIPSSIPSSHFALSSVPSSSGLSTPASASLGSARRSTWSEEDEDTFKNSPTYPEPRVRRGRSSPGGRTRRWTLAMAITDDEMTDEMFVDEVESMRTQGKFWESRKSLDSPTLSRFPVSPSTGSSTPSTFAPRLKHALPCLSEPLLSATWRTARHTLLTCRELIRTERHYLSFLFALVSNETATPVPALMLTYVPALVQASEDLLLRMEVNPSAQGVAEAFLEGESGLEAAFIAWCGVAASFFSQSGRDRAGSTNASREIDSPIVIPLKRRMSTWVQRRNSSIKRRDTATATDLSRKNSDPPKTSRSLPSVRDLAILPTQRVMRYALLFRDLLANVPASSPSYSSVKRALQAAITLAQKSDRAQGNAAFLC
ncbi:hypothetical protein GGX14DRAFT_460160 [Mycena pura]|uniref:DH domain-containing protein n=1 Tax=Mycena pura TaxID=153505 RepID=A0AAD6VAK0_9AGAR|nr:hypothetical protein GGX14DRAFT_460160 [Mycena pura]